MVKTVPLEISDGDVKKEEKSRAAQVVFMSVVAMASIIGGFGMTITMAKRRDPTMFAKGLFPKMHEPKPGERVWSEYGPPSESGGQLAMRALGWGTFYACAGFGTFIYGVWKLIGAKDLQEFRIKVGSMLPVIPKNNPPQGRTEFDSLTDLLQYVIDEDERLKQEKSS